MVSTQINGKYPIILPEHRAERPEWHTKEGWEKARLESMHEHIKKGMTVLYIGSELADMPALCALWGANMILVEPNPSSWPSAKLIFEANKLKTPLNYCGFASDMTKETPLAPDQDHFGRDWWELGSDGWPKCAHNELQLEHGFSQLDKQADGAPQIRIDDLVEKYNLKIDVISCDTEGSEARIFRGATKTLTSHMPVIYLSGHEEIMLTQYNEKLDALREHIKNIGYSEKELDNHHEKHLEYKPL